MCVTDGPSLKHDIPVLLGIVREIEQETSKARSNVAPFKAIFEQYQEQPQLLDAHLEELLQPLLAVLAESSNHLMDAEHFASMMQVCRMLQIIVHTCGRKTVSLFLPNKPPDLSKAVAVLAHVHAVDAKQEIDEDSQDGHWQTVHIVLLWLSVLVLVPFDLAAIEMPAVQAHDGRPSISDFATWLISSIRDNLALPGPNRDVTAVVLSKLVTRAEMIDHRQQLLLWCWTVLAPGHGHSLERSFLIAGVLEMLASMLKDGSRKVMIAYIHQAYTHVSRLLASGGLTTDTLARKLACKVIQRCALTLLDPLRENCIATATKLRKQQGVMAPSSSESELLALTSSGQVILPGIIDELLKSLRDQDTVVRWSAAKGLGRIAARLPGCFVEDVNDAILELFSPLETDSAWQGGCLALAEVARQGLLATQRLPNVVPLVCEALQFEQRRGAFSVGAHVRDAAAYVCWAFARAYRPEAVLKSFQHLAPALLCTACYDREVACRRAAAAAFQESVGRFGAQNFPEGMDIIADADYFTLGSRTQAYLKVAPAIAALPRYRVALFEHLMHHKLPSWDPAVRELAALALAELAKIDPPFATEQIFSYILPSCLITDSVELPHGASLALSSMLPALCDVGYQVNLEQQSRVIDVALNVGASDRSNGQAGDVMRIASCRLIGVLGSLAYALNLSQVTALLAIINETLQQTSYRVQEAASRCLQTFFLTYHSQIPCDQIQQYCKLLVSHTQCKRIGGALALAVIPQVLVQDHWENISQQICASIDAATAPERQDVDSRVAAIKALVAVLHSGWQGGVHASGVKEDEACVHIGLPVLLRTLDDYTTDRRGDVGSLIREAGMGALLQLCHQLMRNRLLPDNEMSTILVDVTCKFLRQAAERIARIRETAARTMMHLLEYQAQLQPGAKVHASARLQKMLNHVRGKGHLSSVQSIPHVIAMMAISTYRPSIFEGAIASIGGIDQNLSQAAADALTAIVMTPDKSEGMQINTAGAGVQIDELDAMTLICTLIQGWQDNKRSTRLATAFLKTLNILLARGAINSKSLTGDDADALVELIRNEGRQCSDCLRLCCIADALCHLTVVGKGDTKRALQAVMVLLCSKIPTVRNYTAERLYVALLMLQRQVDSDPSFGTWSSESLNAVQILLCSVNWGSVECIDELKIVRDNVLNALSIAAPVKKEKRKLKEPESRLQETSYRSLLYDFERGL